MSMHEENVRAIVDYIEGGIKDANDNPRLGIEIEHVVVGEHKSAVPYSGEYGVRWILEQYAQFMPEKTFANNGELLGLAGGSETLTLEPAAQLELSAGPYEYASDFSEDYRKFQHLLNGIISEKGMSAVAIGYHPTAKADDLELIPKQRYRFMDAHFAKIGPFGRCMMRGSAATQVSIDYYSTEDCLRKLRLACAIAPLLALMCDNSPVFEGEPRTHHMVRTEIWQKCDPARCGTVPGALAKDFSLEDYAEYVLRTPAIFGIDENGNSVATEKTFDELYADRPMTRGDVEHALSLFFNDARLKTYLEIRPADSLPLPFACAYVTMIKGLFYYPESLDALDELTDGVDEDAVEAARCALMADGYDAIVYGRPAGEAIDALVEIAHRATPPGEAILMLPLLQLVKTRKTLAMLGG